MSLVQYQNYQIPLAGNSQSEQSWIRRNWPTVLQILGYIFVVGGMVAKEIVDKTVPLGKISNDDWEMLISATQNINPSYSRQEAIKKLCQVFGTRAPSQYCVESPQVMPEPLPPGPPGQIPSLDLEEPTIAGLPVWLVLLGGVGAAFLFLR